ncbi:nucleotidyltransferase domain-containing protein [Microbacterium sp. MEC084]|uniref:nucleotidyltransferase domain-containing protein n=1 Tax=Microbacterium sp. MEC084 TaxID=1963027 RepID=UPI0010704DFD|nr:nucleotidyltransferase domain-containing protein [Microbacterium sp. MEC084]MCD1267752.1 nucleotidyltransferase domain-containing protein [Microbacterium sp. MEC084]
MMDQRRLRQMADALAGLPGIVAVSLGGSRARGTHRPDSDFDLGVYYRAGGLDLAAMGALAARWTGESVPVAGPGGWGSWVDGGAWLRVDGTRVDWILRDVARVDEQCDRAARGEYAFHPQPGHPLGFLDVSYAGEVATAIPLSDASGVLAGLAARVTPYPEPLRKAMLDGLWQADFLLEAAQKGARRADTTYVALCLSHAAMLVAHAWHAAAGAWVINEKGLVPSAVRLGPGPRRFVDVATAALARPGATPEELAATIDALRAAPRPAA